MTVKEWVRRSSEDWIVKRIEDAEQTIKDLLDGITMIEHAEPNGPSIELLEKAYHTIRMKAPWEM